MPQPVPLKGARLIAFNDQMAMWKQKPWLEVSHEMERLPVRFEGRDALTAFGFINFFIQQCENLDPGKKVRDALLAQGITAENFHQHAENLMIRNPFTPKE